MRNRWTSIFALIDPPPGVGGTALATRPGCVRHPARSPAKPRVNGAIRPAEQDNVVTHRAGPLLGIILLVVARTFPSLAQTQLSLATAAELAAARAPEVNTGTLLAFAYHESRLRPFAIHDDTTRQSSFPASAVDAVTLTHALLALGHSVDLGIMQVNSANFARTGLTVTTAFDPGESMRAGAMILTEAYRQCSRGHLDPGQAVQQAALRCAASVYNTGDEQAGIANGYQPGVWRAASEIVPAIQSALRTGPSPPTAPAEMVAPEPRRPPPRLEDALHAAPPVPDDGDGLSDASHLTKGKDPP
jgi:type IV secretion system protein VirB1